MASLARFVWSAFRSTSTASEEGRPSTVSCNPETGVGLLAAVTDPASSHLRVANRINIKTVATTDLASSASSSRNDDGASCSTSTTSRENKSCRLCSCRIGGKTIYIYSGLEFCTLKCRFRYVMRRLYDERHREVFGVPAGRWISEEVRALLVSEEDERTIRHLFLR